MEWDLHLPSFSCDLVCLSFSESYQLLCPATQFSEQSRDCFTSQHCLQSSGLDTFLGSEIQGWIPLAMAGMLSGRVLSTSRIYTMESFSYGLFSKRVSEGTRSYLPHMARTPNSMSESWRRIPSLPAHTQVLWPARGSFWTAHRIFWSVASPHTLKKTSK